MRSGLCPVAALDGPSLDPRALATSPGGGTVLTAMTNAAWSRERH